MVNRDNDAISLKVYKYCKGLTNMEEYVRFWEQEEPLEAKNEYGRIAYFPTAKKLQLSRPDWVDDNDKVRPGKTVTFSVNRFKGDEQAKHILNKVIADL